MIEGGRSHSMRNKTRLRRLDLERRALMRTLAGVPAAFLLARPSEAWTRLEPTPDCGDEPTPSSPAGPYFKPDSPERVSLREAGLEGTRLLVSGRVLTTGCKPVARALLDFWHADTGGEYDVSGFRLRGHQFTDAGGRFRLETILPGVYGRARHIHVRAQAPGGPVLTTELFFQGDPSNAGDRLFQPRLAMAVGSAGAERSATFDFVLGA
jgi:protocatechuate 3,4-dioxygenase beta subunit